MNSLWAWLASLFRRRTEEWRQEFLDDHSRIVALESRADDVDERLAIVKDRLDILR